MKMPNYDRAAIIDSLLAQQSQSALEGALYAQTDKEIDSEMIRERVIQTMSLIECEIAMALAAEVGDAETPT